MSALRRLGVVVHPYRDVSVPRGALVDWAQGREVELVALGARNGAAGEGIAPGDAAGCEAVVAIGGDGTVLGGVRAAAPLGVPILGIACGSLGMLTAVHADDVHEALDRFAAGRWVARELGALHATGGSGSRATAINDVAVVRKGSGQVKADILVGGERYARLAGDGVVVSTPLGSSAYGMAAGGPLLLPLTDALVVTPLAPHGSNAPSLVVPGDTAITLELDTGHGGYRVEADGQPTDVVGPRLDLGFRAGHAVLVGFDDQEPFLAGLRRRLLITDSPRMTAPDQRMARERKLGG